MALIEIDSEISAYEILKETLRQSEENSSFLDFEFGEWFQFHFVDKSGNSSVDIHSMRALLAFQDSIFRLFCQIKYDTNDIRKLTDAEKEELRIVFSVAPGSTDVKGLLQKVADALQKTTDKLSGKQLTIVILGAALISAGTIAHKDYLDAEVEMQKENAASLKDQQVFETLRFSMGVHAEQTKILTEALGQSPQLRGVKELLDEGKKEILKNIPPDRDVVINGVEIDGEDARRISKLPRDETRKTSISGTYTVTNVNSSSETGFRVRLRNVATGEEINAGLTAALVFADQREVVKEAEWSRSQIFATLETKTRHGKIVDAQIVRAKIVDIDTQQTASTPKSDRLGN